METIFKYYVRGFGDEFYCKVNEIAVRDTVFYSFAFGGKHVFCFVAAMDPSRNNNQPYIDRVEYNQSCIKEGVLDEKGGTFKLVKCALWTMTKLFNHISKFTLTDDSYIYCKRGSKEHKMSLAYDSIFKYNKTWYENKFNATLPTSQYEDYKKSLAVLDKQIQPFSYMVEILPKLKKYEDEYKSSTTPREFIKAIRDRYKENYCYELDWLSQYAEHIGINYYKQDWFIPVENVEMPEEYDLFISNVPMKGGILKRKKLSRKCKKVGHGCVGYAATFEY